MTFKEKLARNTPEDQIEIGQIVEAALKGNFGDLLKCIVEGIMADELQNSRAKSALPADRTLGRLESLDMLTERLDQCVDIKNQLLVTKKAESEVK